VDSENSDGAENQQERLRQQGWVIGLVDGEGCFSIGLARQTGGKGRKGYKTGYRVAHEFAVTQGARKACLALYELEIAQTMNRQKPRTDLLRILRGHTPNIQDTGR
jgi:hypothetical protein